MRTRTRRAGASALVILGLFLGGLSSRASPSQRPEGRQEPYALIAGTVFRAEGFTLPGARILLEPEGQVRGSPRLKRQEAISDARGEFAFRVPAREGRYRISAEAAGYRRQQKEVQISGEERVDVFFRLEKASKK